jgi:hypothetical protein
MLVNQWTVTMKRMLRFGFGVNCKRYLEVTSMLVPVVQLAWTTMYVIHLEYLKSILWYVHVVYVSAFALSICTLPEPCRLEILWPNLYMLPSMTGWCWWKIVPGATNESIMYYFWRSDVFRTGRIKIDRQSWWFGVSLYCRAKFCRSSHIFYCKDRIFTWITMSRIMLCV